jgi:hypothetical protein
MQIFVQKDGQQLGPYTLDQVNEYLAQGSLQATDPAWHEGLADWCPLNQIAGVVDASSPAPPAFDSAAFSPNAAAPPAVVQSDVPHPGSLTENDPKNRHFWYVGGGVSLICLTALLYWMFSDGDKLPTSSASKPLESGDSNTGGSGTSLPPAGVPAPATPSESDLKVFRELAEVAETINRDLPKKVGLLILVKMEPKLPREIHYHYEVPALWRPFPDTAMNLINTYKTAPQNEAFRRDKVTQVWHYRDPSGKEVAVFSAGPND